MRRVRGQVRSPVRRPVGRGGGFTLIELLVVITIISLLIGILLPSLGQARRAARQIKDTSDVRQFVSVLAIWAQANQGSYPLPSRLDTNDRTMSYSATPREKDNTGNILSVLIYNGALPVGMLVSSAEVNVDIQPDTRYELARPLAAEEPDGALWDPGFTGVPGEVSGTGRGRGRRFGGAIGNTSYAHIPPFGQRAKSWAATFMTDEAVIGTRGPRYEGSPGNWSLEASPFGRSSNTLLLHGSERQWQGAVAFNDGHAEQLTEPDPDTLRRPFPGLPPGQATQADNMFVLEDDEFGVPLTESEPGAAANTLLRSYRNVQSCANCPGGVKVIPFWD